MNCFNTFRNSDINIQFLRLYLTELYIKKNITKIDDRSNILFFLLFGPGKQNRRTPRSESKNLRIIKYVTKRSFNTEM